MLLYRPRNSGQQQQQQQQQQQKHHCQGKQLMKQIFHDYKVTDYKKLKITYLMKFSTRH
tara:strand:+ start:105 stop:281 length:177 start_codon:yes stop_codon:yes gene_type:complete